MSTVFHENRVSVGEEDDEDISVIDASVQHHCFYPL